MKLKLEDASVAYHAEGGEQLLGISVKTATGYSLYRPLNADYTEWERLASSKNPIDFDKIIFNKKVSTIKSKTKTDTEELAKNNKEETALKQVKSKTTKKGKAVKTSSDSKKVKKSFL